MVDRADPAFLRVGSQEKELRGDPGPRSAGKESVPLLSRAIQGFVPSRGSEQSTVSMTAQE